MWLIEVPSCKFKDSVSNISIDNKENGNKNLYFRVTLNETKYLRANQLNLLVKSHVIHLLTLLG
jgi:hypothetical protein